MPVKKRKKPVSKEKKATVKSRISKKNGNAKYVALVFLAVLGYLLGRYIFSGVLK